MKSNKIILLAVFLGGFAVFAGIIAFAGEGGVRHVNIFLPEQIKQTIAFQEIDGEIKLVGIAGIGGEPNPDLVMRAGDYEYVLTVINQDDSPHSLYIEGIEVQTKILQPGEKETLVTIFTEENTYNLYDGVTNQKFPGTLTSVFVVPKDRFEEDSTVQTTSQEVVDIARDFTISSPTYMFDGIEKTLNVEIQSERESFPVKHVILITYDSRHGGYGDRTDQVLTQAITPHTMEVIIVSGKIISAVIDNHWDELNQIQCRTMEC